MKNVVVIGGGTGQSIILRGIKQLENINLSAIVTVADDGGSTGRLRRQYNIPAMGDIRSVMCALAESETLLSSLMNYRFEGDENDGDIGGHNLGNLILTALSQSSGNFMNAIQVFSKVLNVRGDIIPSTEQVITLFATMEDGTIVRGESNIPKFKNQIKRVFYEEEVKASQMAVDAIKKADYIVFGIGSLYTSILPNLIIGDIKDALKNSFAKKIYFCNVMSQPGETDYYSLENHVQALVEHTFPGIIDIVVTHNNELKEKTLAKYAAMGSTPVWVQQEQHDYQVIRRDLLTFENSLIRHDSDKIRDIMEELMNHKEVV